MPVRSLRQEEAVERAALLSVTSYDIAIDLTGLVDGPDFRAVSTVRFTATRGSVDVRRLLRGGGVGHAQRRAAARGRGGPDRPGRPRRGQRAGGRHGAERHHARPRRAPRRRPRRRQRLPVDHLRARRGALRVGLLRPARPQGTARLHRHRTGGVDRGQQLRRPGGRGRRRRAEVDLRAHAAAVDVQPRRGGRPVRGGAPGGRWLRPRPVRPPDPGLRAGARRRAGVHAHRPGPRLLRRAVRHALPAAHLRPGVPARVRRGDGELRVRHLGRRHPAPPRAHHQRVAAVHQRAAARDGAHVVRQHRHHALVGRPLAQRGLRRVRLHVGGRAGHRLRRHGRQQPGGRQAGRLPRRPGPQLAPHPPARADRGRRRVDLRLHHLPQGRRGAQAAHVLRGRGDLLPPA